MNRRKNPNIWGPPFWFTLHTICQHYPAHPNSVIKKKYYDFLSNIPLFLPHEPIGDKFAELLDKYPLNPYLESQPQLCKWMHFIHNKINNITNKPTMPYNEYVLLYDSYYISKPPPPKSNIISFSIIIFFFIAIIIYLHQL
jgi:hypothetical protein